MNAYQRETNDLHPDPAWRPQPDYPTSDSGLDLGAGRDPNAAPYDRGGRYGDLVPAETLEEAVSTT